MAKHSRFGFSGASRYWEDACPASIRLTRNVPNETNPAAELGTAAHELGEFCILYGAEPKTCIGMTFNNHVVDEAMVDAVNVYVGWVKALEVLMGVKAQVELRVVMTSLGRNDVYGTSDLVLVDLTNRRLYVGDYKHGYGVVEVLNNKQLIGYAISALDTLDLWQHIDEVVTTVVQPRASHCDGPVRSHSYSTTELVEWQQRYANSIRLAEDPTSKPKAGDHCTYCRRSVCRERWDYIMNVISPDAPNDELTEKEVGFIYTKLDVLRRFADRITEEAVKIARSTGLTPEGYKPVKSIHRAKVENEQALIEAARAQGVNTQDMFEQKLKSKTKLKKVLPPKVLNEFFVTPPSTITIAKLSDNRPAVRVGSVEGVFKPIKD